MIFDTHAHYDSEAFDQDRGEVLQSLAGNGVGKVVNVGASLRGSMATCDLMQKYEFVYGAVGVHPNDVGELDEEKLDLLRSMLSYKKVVAVGEIGLDYYWGRESRELQQKWFRAQIELALEAELPVVIHSREAAQDTFDILRKYHFGKQGFRGGIIHCYSGSAEMAREYVKMGYNFGVGGIITFKNSRVLKEVVAEVPMENIVVETDCPYLTPVPHRSERNCSIYLPYVIEEIARVRGMTPAEVEDATYRNAMRIYGITDETCESEGGQYV